MSVFYAFVLFIIILIVLVALIIPFPHYWRFCGPHGENLEAANIDPKLLDGGGWMLEKAYTMFKIPKKGLIHVGASRAEEIEIYSNTLGIKDILYIEANPENEPDLKKAIANFPGAKVAIFAASDTNGTMDFHVTSNKGLSSSLLKLNKHLKMSPDVKPAKTIKVDQKRLDDYLATTPDSGANYNLMVVDTQGAELMVFKGAQNTLTHIDAIISELNFTELYSGGVLLPDLDTFLLQNGFYRVATQPVTKGYGDGLYIKKSLLSF